jgi:predicted regulator of Ras-like GTPase activity (Roadblock/LC7/MglB family)
MELPAGIRTAVITNPHDEGALRQMMSFYGVIEIDTSAGSGFLLADHGVLIAAFFRDSGGSFRGRGALDRMSQIHADEDGFRLSYALYSYNSDEFSKAISICTKEEMVLSEQKKGSLVRIPKLIDTVKLTKILSLPGVIAVSVFFEGFPVQSLGEGDFEHVAVLAEDLLRAGIKITREMDIGNPEQIILETNIHKILIAPCGDLFLCVVTRNDAQLGLLRVALRNLQSEQLCTAGSS